MHTRAKSYQLDEPLLSAFVFREEEEVVKTIRFVCLSVGLSVGEIGFLKTEMNECSMLGGIGILRKETFPVCDRTCYMLFFQMYIFFFT